MAFDAKNTRAEIARLNNAISAEEHTINDLFRRIGQTYFSAHKNDPEESQAANVKAVIAAVERGKRFKEQINAIRGITVCPGCGAEVPITSLFCSRCGTKMPVKTPPAPQGEGGAQFCRQCGNRRLPGQKFCVNCGTPFPAAQPPIPPVQGSQGQPIQRPVNAPPAGHPAFELREPGRQNAAAQPAAPFNPFAEPPKPPVQPTVEPPKPIIRTDAPAQAAPIRPAFEIPQPIVKPDLEAPARPDPIEAFVSAKKPSVLPENSVEPKPVFDPEVPVCPEPVLEPELFDRPEPAVMPEIPSKPEASEQPEQSDVPENPAQPDEPSPKVCPKCGAELEPDSIFCLECGTKL